ncbi:unnamed protein product [Linum tenue]|uniref:F-box domain-containing protein n=1 Tax=Linum tenue TaxID=586396 RepID=A0AAV0R521_9ROSI|nr:unnamed protein product [Linum tenue]
MTACKTATFKLEQEQTGFTVETGESSAGTGSGSNEATAPIFNRKFTRREPLTTMDVPGPENKNVCRRDSGNDGDRISSLPQSIIEHILTFIPLREAVKTSILSTAWRNKWVNRPSLIFDDRFWTSFPVFETSAQHEGVYVVDPNRINRLVLDVFRVLCYHKGPLKEFSLSIPQLSSYPALVDQILLSLHEKCIERLCIEIDGYKLPSRLFSFRQLKKLKLFACGFTSSQISFDQFSVLTCLDLRSTKFPDVAGVSLVVRCPLLSVLIMVDCGSAFNRLDILIEAPSLSRFHCAGSFSSLRVKEAPLLKDVTIYQTASFVAHPMGTDDPSNCTKLCGGCPAVERLSITMGLFKDLPASKMMAQPLAKLMMLKQLRMGEMCCSNLRDVLACLLLMEHSPNLQELIIDTVIKPSPCVDVEVRLIQLLCESRTYKPSRLEKVELNQLQGLISEMCFLRWLLSASPALDKMEITFSANSLPSEQIRTLKALNEFQRASSKAQIKIK